MQQEGSLKLTFQKQGLPLKRPLEGEEGPLAQQQYLARLQELQNASDTSLADYTKMQNSYPQGNVQPYLTKYLLYPLTTPHRMQHTVLDDTKSACSLSYCSTARANATEWSYGRTARNKEEERTAEECGGDGPAVHEQKQASCDARAGLTHL